MQFSVTWIYEYDVGKMKRNLIIELYKFSTTKTYKASKSATRVNRVVRYFRRILVRIQPRVNKYACRKICALDICHRILSALVCEVIFTVNSRHTVRA